MDEATGSALETIKRHSPSPAPLTSSELTTGEAAAASSSTPEITFVSDWLSPFAQRTWFALEQRGIPYIYKEATKAQKADDGSNYHPSELLPCIELPDGRVVRGSIPCIEYLEEAFPQYPSMWSADLIDRARERVWTDWIRRTCIPTFMRVLRARQEEKLEASSLELCRVLDIFAAEVRGPFFSGKIPTLPDIVIAPFILRTRMRITNRPFHLVHHADATAGERYQEYATRLLKLDALQRTSPDAEEPIDCPSPPVRVISSTAPKLPPEIITLILKHTRDYELAVALGMKHALPETTPWAEQSTRLDRAILTGNLSKVQDIYNGTTTTSYAQHPDSAFTLDDNNKGNNSTSTPKLPKSPFTRQMTASSLPCRRFSRWGARCMIRFAYIHILDWLYSVNPEQVHSVCDELLPEVASAWGRVEVLDWAYRRSTFGIQKSISPRAIDDASRNGHVDVLQWWLTSGIEPLAYSEDALNHATIKLQIPTLEWWKHSGLPLKIGNVMDFASMVKSTSTASLDWWKKQIDLSSSSSSSSDDMNNVDDEDAIFSNVTISATASPARARRILGGGGAGGGNTPPNANNNGSAAVFGLYTKMALYQASNNGNITLLNWWKESGLPLVYDKEVLIGATKQGKVESLDWWLNSKLPISYTVFDIEEAIEDAISGREEVEEWWKKHGLSRYSNAQNWTKSRFLGRY